MGWWVSPYQQIHNCLHRLIGRYVAIKVGYIKTEDDCPLEGTCLACTIEVPLIELHQCTKFGVDISKFPRIGGSLSNKYYRSWRAQLVPHINGNYKSTQIGVL